MSATINPLPYTEPTIWTAVNPQGAIDTVDEVVSQWLNGLKNLDLKNLYLSMLKIWFS